MTEETLYDKIVDLMQANYLHLLAENARLRAELDAYRDKNKRQMVDCNICNGKGHCAPLHLNYNTNDFTCSNCNGTGKVRP